MPNLVLTQFVSVNHFIWEQLIKIRSLKTNFKDVNNIIII